MEYAQLNQDGSFSHQINTHGNVAWDANNYCSAEALVKDGIAELFMVAPLLETDPPTINLITQSVIRDGGELVNGNWQYKWTINDLDQATIDANIATAQAVLQAAIIQATQDRLDAFARTRSYDGILSACTYATSPTPRFATDGTYCLAQRDATWAALYTILGEVQAAIRPVPSSFADIEGDLPQLTWPIIP